MIQEILSLHIEQASLQMANAFWELLCLEHQLQISGYARGVIDEENHLEIFFDEMPCGNHVPRAILFDMEPSVAGG